jgi:hypothetical protein
MQRQPRSFLTNCFSMFFPSFSPAVGTIAAYGSYAAGFVARPRDAEARVTAKPITESAAVKSVIEKLREKIRGERREEVLFEI